MIRWAVFLLILFPPVVGCAREGQNSVGSPASPDTPGIYSTSRLRLSSDPGAVIVRIDDDVALTVAEFNERLMEFPIADLGQSVVEARKLVLDQMIDAKVIVREARKRRGGETGSLTLDGKPYQEERALAQTVIKADIANPFLVTDQEAVEFLKQNPAVLQTAQGGKMTDVERLHVKFTMLSARFQEKKMKWRDEVKLELSEGLLEAE